MFRFNRSLGRVAAVAVGAAAMLAVAAPGASAGPDTDTPDVPGRITVPAGNKLFLVGHAAGVQIYRCNTTASGFAWGLVAPRATLSGANGQFLTSHFGGPTWQATDGSAVVAARVDGVTVDAGAIPWLLLDATATTEGEDGDRLTPTTYIQRVNTTGGLPPAAASCDAAAVGQDEEIPYTADYFFWKATGAAGLEVL